MRDPSGTGFVLDPGFDVLGRVGSASRAVGARVRASAIPETGRLATPLPARQGRHESCLGFAVRQSVHLWRSARAIAAEDVSPWYAYWWARRRAVPVDGLVMDIGSSPTHMVAAVRAHGLAHATDWEPLVPGFGVNERPPAVVRLRAQKVKLDLRSVYAWGDGAPVVVRDALAERCPVILALPVDSLFMRDEGVDVADPPAAQTGLLHAVTAFEYRRGAVRIANSWGSEWRDSGSSWISDAYVRTAKWIGVLQNVRSS